MNRAMSRGKLGIVGVALAVSISLFPVSYSAETTELPLYNLNQTLRDDVTSAVHLNYRTEETSSSRDAQPETIVYYYLAEEEFDVASNQKVSATATKSSKISYHKADIDNLKPGTAYNYRIVDNNSGAVSKEYSFRTKASVDSFSFIAASDANYRTTSSYQNYFGNTLSKAVEHYPEAAFILHTGQANSSLSSEAYWDGYFQQAGSTYENYPLVATTSSTGSSNKAFTLNHNLTASGNDMANYSFVYGDALFLQLNTKLTSTAAINSHLSWLKEEVAAKGANKWKIVSINNSFYGAGSNTTTIKKKLEEAFAELGIHLVIQGNEAAYQRSYPIKNGTILSDYPSDQVISGKDGTIYVSPGAAGIEQKNGNSGNREWMNTASDFSSSSEKKLAEKKMYTAIQVTAEKIEATAYTVDGETVDTFQINHSATPEREAKELTPYALNNAFSGDAKTTRSISWQTDTTMMFSDPFVEVVSAGDAFTSENKKVYSGTLEKNKQIFTKKATNKVQLDGLTAGTAYQYRVGNIFKNAKTGSETTYYGPVYTFTTEAESAQPFTFLHLADSQSSTAGYAPYFGNTLSQALNRFPDAPFVIHTGDMVETPNESHFTAFFNAIGTKMAGTAFLPVLGNHEYKTSEAFYQSAFNVDSVNGFPLNYSYVYGNVLFFNINSNYDSTANLDKQIAWMKAEVAEKGAGKFIVVSFHKSPYGGKWTSSSSSVLGSKNIKAKLVPVMETLGVNLVLSGHDHNYIRSLPIKNGQPVTDMEDTSLISTSQNGTIYMVSRNSGEKTYKLEAAKAWTDVRWAPTGDITGKDNLPENTVFSAISVEDDALKVTVYTAAYQVIDSYTITK
ncbi:fibronectin type III domain-containing protein [Enterococcus sp. BWR-S5]|uniref:fibronectin type III domain-containing protein n=1 Tax=Enterococcus sp. BWR-S5 TaxID=2787714 RepID=UPI001924DD40|nr:fibronectin type III domain-containing protein [Enterococcus sp. BWR-S5]MBL1223782.1 fibronectin type III domain-containing protein [Enterococcus sp. BWR-S5]